MSKEEAKDQLDLEKHLIDLLRQNGYSYNERSNKWEYDAQRQLSPKPSYPDLGNPEQWPGGKDFKAENIYARPELLKQCWQYNQRTGQLRGPDGKLHQEKGYSGILRYKNDPSAETLGFRGPIPKGGYEIGRDKGSKGPLSLELTPRGHDARGRDNFLIHGDSTKNPGRASEGCIVLNRQQRETIHRSKYRFLEVLDEPEWK